MTAQISKPKRAGQELKIVIRSTGCMDKNMNVRAPKFERAGQQLKIKTSNMDI